MKIGIIIVFHNNEKEIDTKFFIEHLNQTTDLELCLVNNASKDKTYPLLKEIKETCTNASIVNIKKFKSANSAVRAGARYMFNQFDLNHLGYVSSNLMHINYQDLNGLIQSITENQDVLLNYKPEFD
jgi:GT2 family glycosyltransferase